MIIRLFYIIIVIFLSETSCKSQIKDNLIEGTWKSVKKELKTGESGEKYTYHGGQYKTGSAFTLNADGTGNEHSLGTTFLYSIQDNLLTIGNRVYIIENLTKTELVLVDVKDGISAFRIYYDKQPESPGS